MKNLFFVVLFLCSYGFNAQRLSDYEYVFVPQNFKEFADNQFKLNSTLVKKLEAKGYKVIQSDNRDGPDELKQNTCKVAFVNIFKSGNMFKIKMTLDAKDCNNKVLFSQQGTSAEKDFEIGYNEALESILIKIPNSLPLIKLHEVKVKFAEKTDPVINVATEKIYKKTDIKPEKDVINSFDNSQNYSNGNLILQKVLIGTGKFILVNQNSSVPYATFTESTKEGVFRVVLENGASTLGYLENGNYVIEILNNDGGFRKEIFEKK